ncbi:hypothetical protein BGX20_006965, partial [Mortierella sp. AD010]
MGSSTWPTKGGPNKGRNGTKAQRPPAGLAFLEGFLLSMQGQKRRVHQGDDVTPGGPFRTTQKVAQTPLEKMDQRSIGPPVALAPIGDTSVQTRTG